MKIFGKEGNEMSRYLDAALHETKSFVEHFLVCLKWIALSLISGLALGLVSYAFYECLSFVTEFRLTHGKIIWALPVAGLFIVFIYEKFGGKVSKGTNMVLAAINSDEKIPVIMLPLIFISTVISHLFGASVGREGAALQMGASFGNTFAGILKLNDNDKKILIMTGMSAAFSALFGTPLAAAVFSMEVISVGVMYYSALVPCVVSALTAASVAKHLGVQYADYKLSVVPEFTLYTGGMTILLGILFAIVSIALCMVLILSERGMVNHIKNPYIRVFAAGLLIACFTALMGTQEYNGLGTGVITAALSGNVVWYAFIIKMLITGVSLSGGYRGGEIVPVLFIGATFGALCGNILGFAPGFCAALGMTAVFCGVTNSPVASILIGIELFGGKGIWFFCLCIAISYMLSGYFGLYKSQLIIYSKYRSVYVHRKTKR